MWQWGFELRSVPSPEPFACHRLTQPSPEEQVHRQEEATVSPGFREEGDTGQTEHSDREGHCRWGKSALAGAGAGQWICHRDSTAGLSRSFQQPVTYFWERLLLVYYYCTPLSTRAWNLNS